MLSTAREVVNANRFGQPAVDFREFLKSYIAQWAGQECAL